MPVIADLYEADFPEVKENREQIIAVLVKEENAFRQTLRKGLKEFEKYADDKNEWPYLLTVCSIVLVLLVYQEIKYLSYMIRMVFLLNLVLRRFIKEE